MSSKIIAVARNTISQAIRMKIAFVLILFLLILLPSLPYLLESDGTQKGQVQLVFTYGIIISSFLLSVLTIFLSCSVLSSEIRQKQIFILDSKPISRWQVLLGKWIGVMVIDVALLLFMALALYLLVAYLARPGRENATGKDQMLLDSEVLVARRSIKPERVEVSEKEVEKRYQEKLRESTRMDLPEKQTKRKIISELIQASTIVPVRQPKIWKFEVSPDPKHPNVPFTIRFFTRDAEYKPDMTFRAQWAIRTPSTPGWVLIQAGDYKTNKNYDITVPSRFVTEGGVIEIRYVHFGRVNEQTGLPENKSVRFPLGEGMQILYRAGGFEMNFLRGLVLILCRIGFLAIVGIVASTFLSFSVASLFTLTVYVFGSAASYISEFIGMSAGSVFTAEMLKNVPVRNLAHRFFYEALLYLFPNLAEFNPIGRLTTGMMIEWLDMFRAIFFLVIIYGGVAAVLGYIIFNRRELAGTHRT